MNRQGLQATNRNGRADEAGRAGHLSIRMRGWWLAAALLLGAAGSSAASIDADADAPALVFGVVPQKSALKLAEEWGPLLRRLSEESGIRLRFATAPDIPTFEQRIAEGQYDLAYMNPYHYRVFSEAPGYRALARATDRRIEGILVVPARAPVASMEQLAGEELAFPAPAAFAATLLTQAGLNQRQVPFQAHYVGSHEAVYRAVAAGRFAAGGGIMRTFHSLPDEVRSQLRVLWVSPAYTPHAIASHPRVSPAAREQLLNALTGLTEPHRLELLRPLRIGGFRAAADSDWDDVRALPLHQTLGTRP